MHQPLLLVFEFLHEAQAWEQDCEQHNLRLIPGLSRGAHSVCIIYVYHIMMHRSFKSWSKMSFPAGKTFPLDCDIDGQAASVTSGNQWLFGGQACSGVDGEANGNKSNHDSPSSSLILICYCRWVKQLGQKARQAKWCTCCALA